MRNHFKHNVICWLSGSFVTSSTAALVHHHVLVVAQHHVIVVVVVEHGDGGEAHGDAAGLRRVLRVQGVHQGLQDGMVGAVQALAEREGALSVAVVGHVALRGDDPVLPAHVFEVDVEAASLAHAAEGHRQVDGAPLLPGATLVRVQGHHDQQGPDQRKSGGWFWWERVSGIKRKQLIRICAEREQLQNQTVV